MTERGLLIVVEGLDRSGKSTQCELLCTRLREAGHEAKYQKFPDRTTPTGKMINSYLAGQEQQDDHSIHLLFSANRWEAASSIRSDITAGVTVVVDRYSYSGAVYSAAKMNPELSLEWAWQPEVGLPKPDITIFLNISAEAAAKRGGYGDERYEKEEMQAKVRILFQHLFTRLEGQNVKEVDAGVSVDEVARGIFDLVEPLTTQRKLKMTTLGPLKSG